MFLLLMMPRRRGRGVVWRQFYLPAGRLPPPPARSPSAMHETYPPERSRYLKITSSSVRCVRPRKKGSNGSGGGGGEQQERDPEAARDGVPHRGRHGARHGDGARGRAARVGGGDGEESLPLLRSLHAQPDDQPQGAQLRPGLRPRGGTVYVFTVI